MIAFEESEQSKHRQENEPRCWFVFLFLALFFLFFAWIMWLCLFSSRLVHRWIKRAHLSRLRRFNIYGSGFRFLRRYIRHNKKIFAKESSHPYNSKVDLRLVSSIAYSEPFKYLFLECWGKTCDIPTSHGQRKKEKNTWYYYIYKTERLALVFREMQFCRRSSIALRGSFGRVLFRSNNGVCVLTIFSKMFIGITSIEQKRKQDPGDSL